MGEGEEGIAASSCDGKNNGLGSCKAHHVSSSPQEDRSVSTCAVGENKSSAEKGRIDRHLMLTDTNESPTVD
jgi:hypothetical protein